MKISTFINDSEIGVVQNKNLLYSASFWNFEQNHGKNLKDNISLF